MAEAQSDQDTNLRYNSFNLEFVCSFSKMLESRTLPERATPYTNQKVTGQFTQASLLTARLKNIFSWWVLHQCYYGGKQTLRRAKEGEEQDFQSDFSFLWQKRRRVQTEIVFYHMEFQINTRILRVILTAAFKNNLLSSLAIILHLTFVQLKYKTFLTL